MSNLVIDHKGNKMWRNSEGLLHRLDGPALETSMGSKEWLVNGKLHRLDGPALDWINGRKEWWVDGVKVTEPEYLQAVLLYKCRMVLES